MTTTAPTITTPAMVVDEAIAIDDRDDQPEIEKLKIRLAGQCGLDPESIMTSRLAQYDLLLSQGLGVRLHVGGSTLFRCNLDYRLLGLTLSDQERKLHDSHVDLGEFFLAPRRVVRQFSNLASQARNYLRRKVGRTIGFEFEPSWVWVPITADEEQGFQAVKARLEEYKAAYLAYAEEVAASVEQHKAETLAAVEEAAPLIYARLDGEVEDTPETFVTGLKRFVEASFPSAERVREQAYFDVQYKAYPMPTQIETDRLKAAELELERHQVEARQHLLWEETEAKGRVLRAKAWAEEQSELEAAQKRKEMLLEMQRQVLEEERQRKEAALDPMIREIAGRVQSLVSEVTAGVAKAVQKKGKLPGPTVRQVRSLVDDLGPLLSLAGDVRLEELAHKLGGLAQKRQGQALDAVAISSTLDELEEAAIERAQALGPSMFDFLEV